MVKDNPGAKNPARELAKKVSQHDDYGIGLRVNGIIFIFPEYMTFRYG
jgi:hypothetical protein